MESSTEAPERQRVKVRRRRRQQAPDTHRGLAAVLTGPGLVTLVLAVLVLSLPLMMGQRTPLTLTSTAVWLTFGGVLAWLLSAWRDGSGESMPAPTAAWWWVFAALSALTLLQILPIRMLAAWFGPYPDALWSHPEFEPRFWSPNPGATLRAWAVFVALFGIAWLSCSLRRQQRGWLWLAILVMALFQSLYGLISHASGATEILGVWARNNPDFVHGTYSNRNLFAGYLALTWPMAVLVWWIRDMPLLRHLPTEMKVAGSLISGAIIGAALMGSASRLGATAGLIGMFVALLLWTRHRGHLQGAAIWPAWLAALAAFLFATWYGLAPLTDRLAQTDSNDEVRFQVLGILFNEVPLVHWLAGVGLGGFEAVFKTVQPAEITGWWDYAHNDLLQWLLETGLVGGGILLVVLVGLVRRAAVRMERIPLYAGLVAMSLVGLGDFSWHIPGTQIVLAIYLGVLLREPGPPRSTDRVAAPTESARKRRRHRRKSGSH